jgi:VanZ family protein
VNRNPVASVLLTLVLYATIVMLSVASGEASPGDGVFVWAVAVTPTVVQKLLHILAYALLTASLVWTLNRIRSIASRLAAAFAIAALTGAALEWFQTMVPGRFGTLTDVVLNAGGAVFGLLFSLSLLRRSLRFTAQA